MTTVTTTTATRTAALADGRVARTTSAQPALSDTRNRNVRARLFGLWRETILSG